MSAAMPYVCRTRLAVSKPGCPGSEKLVERRSTDLLTPAMPAMKMTTHATTTRRRCLRTYLARLRMVCGSPHCIVHAQPYAGIGADCHIARVSRVTLMTPSDEEM